MGKTKRVNESKSTNVTPVKQTPASNTNKPQSKKRKVEEVDEIETFNSKVLNSIQEVANAIREGNKILERVYPREYTGEEIYKELVVMGLDPLDIPRYLTYLGDNQAKARTLFSCPLKVRMSVLEDMTGYRYADGYGAMY